MNFADKIVILDKFKYNGKRSKYFIAYLDDNITRPLCIILPQMNWYTKYFNDGGENMSLKIEDSVLVKYHKITSNIKKTLKIKFHSLFMMKNT